MAIETSKKSEKRCIIIYRQKIDPNLGDFFLSNSIKVVQNELDREITYLTDLFIEGRIN